MSLKPKVALAQDFLLQLAKLPVSVHSKVLKWAVKFQVDPVSSGINYERIKGALDPNLKSVRIGDDWRGIVFKPDNGDVYVLLHVAHHDEAYRWAEKRKLTINPVTGAMQMVTMEHVIEQVVEQAVEQTVEQADDSADTAAPQPARPLYAALSDTELMSLGVPEELLAAVRTIRSEEALDDLQSRLPNEAYEGLFLVAAGDTVSQVLQARETRVDQRIDTADFATALTTAESQSRFVVVEDDEAMMAVLHAPLAQWRVFLHPTQNKLARGDRSGPVRVLGGAGTGKTVLAMHRAKWLTENRTPAGKKVLFTTFTRNLALDIEENLKTLCNADTMAKIEVRNLDAWVSGFMRSHKLEHRIVYDRKHDGALQAWQAALATKDAKLDLPDRFYAEELEQVVLAQGITTLDQYRMARRTGRGVILGRAKRDAVWPVFEEYRGQLASRRLKEVDNTYRDITEMITADSALHPGYAAIVIDETQDLGSQALRLLRAMVAPGPNDLFFVGDGHQRIYSRNRAVMSRCGIDIRGRSRKLYLNYRTTDEIRRQAVALLEGCEIDDLDDGQDETRRYKSLSHGPPPELRQVSGLEEAAAATIAFTRQWRAEQGEHERLSLCVVSDSEKSRDALGQRLQAAGLPCVSITAQSNHTDVRGVVHLATMHRAKGLEFDCTIVIAPQSWLGPAEATAGQRRLLYVALTRAKRVALLLQVS
jgi:superfamily I DNA/RNA helicase